MSNKEILYHNIRADATLGAFFYIGFITIVTLIFQRINGSVWKMLKKDVKGDSMYRDEGYGGDVFLRITIFLLVI